jgi:hypothetical protein
MPALTVYLSRLIGVVSLIIAAAMILDKTIVATTVEHLGQDRTALLLIGSFRVICGAAIVLIHNVWNKGFWPMVVTLTGWAMLVRGVLNLFLPPEIMAALLVDTHVIDLYYLYAAIPVVLGAYLTLRGFSVTAPPFEMALLQTTAPTDDAKPATARQKSAK